MARRVRQQKRKNSRPNAPRSGAAGSARSESEWAATDDAFVQYLETQAEKTQQALEKMFDRHWDRALRLVTPLAAASGAAASWMAGRWDAMDCAQRMAMLILAAGWALSAGLLAVRGMRSYSLPPGSDPDEIKAAYRYYGGNFRKSQRTVTKARALQRTRMGEVRRLKEQMGEMAQANNERSKALTLTLRCASVTPVMALLAWVLALLCLRS